MAATFSNLCNEFLNVVTDTYVFYLDAFKGLEMVRTDVEDRQEADQFSDDNSDVPYLKQYEEPVELHKLVQTNLGAFKKRNAEDGRNYEMLGNLCLVAIYSWWEDSFREKFATYLGKTKNEIKFPIMGDIRLLRIAIIHNTGVATEDCERCELLKWFKRGDRIVLTFENFERIILEIKIMLETFYMQSMIVGEE
ncbi:MAG: hypothetical protein ABI042_12690 [Verrucomicrobiota bacterium]